MSPYERSSALCRARKARNQFAPSCVCATIRTAILVNSSPDHHWNKHGADDVIVDHQCSIQAAKADEAKAQEEDDVAIRSSTALMYSV